MSPRLTAHARKPLAVTGQGAVALFVITLFLSAFLMFLLEPMAAKMLLPLLGGAPAVWNTCVVFFQAMLLAGYAYAHGVPVWLGVRRHAVVHALLVVLPLFLLPFSLADSRAPQGNPVLWLLTTLLASIGLPFFVLTTTAPLVQKWFSRTDHKAARDPYFLYAASNAGSLAGLIAYPALVEPALRLSEQSRLWTAGYVVFAALIVACVSVLWRRGGADATAAAPSANTTWIAPIGALRRLRWIGLSFAPSSLMLAVTTFVSTDVAAVPLLWIVPLSLYLLTFVLAFNSERRYPRGLIERGFPLLLLPLVLFLVLRVTGPMVVVLPIHLAVFFLAALWCHQALADDRPDPAHLTAFFFWVALGGVLGSLFNTLAAPILFTGIAEYPLVLVLVCFLRGTEPSEGGKTRASAFVAPLVAGVLTSAVMLAGPRLESLPVRFALLFTAAFLCLRVSRQRIPFAVGIAVLLIASGFFRGAYGAVLHAERTFFGSYRVRLDPARQVRSIFHGTTLHGMQSIDPQRRKEPLAYHHRSGPFGDVYSSIPAAAHSEVAVVGLGVGALAAYQRHHQRWTFYEIDPAVERMARNAAHFTYMADCAENCRVLIGDARLSLMNASAAAYGMIVVDAFSSDAIPVHLMTKEALELYFSKLTANGALVFHISNRHLALEPVLGRLARELKLATLIRRDNLSEDVTTDGRISSDWLVMTRQAADLGALSGSTLWVPPIVPPDVPLWTDDFSNILSVLRN